MIRDRSVLENFVNKVIGTVRFGNYHFGVIMGYGDCVLVTANFLGIVRGRTRV